MDERPGGLTRLGPVTVPAGADRPAGPPAPPDPTTHLTTDVPGAGAAGPEQAAELRCLVDRLTTAAAALTPGWLGAPLASGAVPPFGGSADPGFVRLGTARLPEGLSFPVVVPWGHLVFDTDARDPRVAGVLGSLLLRWLATVPPRGQRVRLVDPDRTLTCFRPLLSTGVLAPPVTDLDGLRAVLDEAERWAAAPPPHGTLTVVVAAFPTGTAAAETTRLARLAARAERLRLLVAGAPATAARLPGATVVQVRPAYARVGDPPGGAFSAPDPAVPAPRTPGGTAAGAPRGGGLNAEVLLDPAPPEALVRRVCERFTRPGPPPDPPIVVAEPPTWSFPAAEGLSTVIGRVADGALVELRFDGTTPHWLVGGARGSGKTTLLHHLVYGFAGRYHPDSLALYLLDPAGTGGLRALAALPHVRGHGQGAEECLARLQELAAPEVAAAGDGPADGSAPVRTLVVVDGLPALRIGTARTLLGTLARTGTQRRLHLLLAGDGPAPPELADRFRVRIALPGGRVLDPANDAAAELAPGEAVVNTAGGLGGPPGVTRAHERVVRFPDPYVDPDALRAWRRRLAEVGSAR